jgi:putative ABC transport system substrate-binding protein
MSALSKKAVLFTIGPLLIILIAGFIYIFSPPHEKPKRIGVLFYQNNPTAVSFLNGLKTGLAKQGYFEGTNLKLYIEYLQDTSPETTVAILKKIEQKRVDALVTTGKDLTITTSHTISDRPILYALVSRPITNETIKNVIDKERNITGVSYFTPYDRTLELGKRVIPDLKKLTLILPYNSAWPDYDRLKEAADKIGVKLSFVETSLANVSKAILDLRGQTDAIYLPYDIQLIFLNDSIKEALQTAKLPAIGNNLEYQSSCVLTYFAEPETIGEIAGRMVVKIFHRAKIKYLPVELSSYYKLTVNVALLKEMDLKIDEDVLSYANEVIQ